MSVNGNENKIWMEWNQGAVDMEALQARNVCSAEDSQCGSTRYAAGISERGCPERYQRAREKRISLRPMGAGKLA